MTAGLPQNVRFNDRDAFSGLDLAWPRQKVVEALELWDQESLGHLAMRLAEGQPKNVKDALLRYPNEPYDDSMTKTLKGRGQIVSDMLADRSHLLGHEENARLYQAVHMEYVRMPEDSIAVAPRTHFRRGPSLTCGDQIICD